MRLLHNLISRGRCLEIANKRKYTNNQRKRNMGFRKRRMSQGRSKSKGYVKQSLPIMVTRLILELLSRSPHARIRANVRQLKDSGPEYERMSQKLALIGYYWHIRVCTISLTSDWILDLQHPSGELNLRFSHSQFSTRKHCRQLSSFKVRVSQWPIDDKARW